MILAAFILFLKIRIAPVFLTKTLTEELCADCKRLSAQLALTLALWYLLVLTYFMFGSMPRSHHSPGQSALCSWAR